MMFLLTYWKVLAVGVIFAAFCGYIGVIITERNHYRSAYEDAQTELDVIALQSAALEKSVIAHNKEIQSQHEQVNQELANDYAKTVSAINHRGNAGVTCRLFKSANSSVSPVSSQASSSLGIDAAPTNAMVARLPQDCAITTEIALGLQKFIRSECSK